MKSKIVVLLATFLFLISVSVPANASVGTKNVNIHYNNIKINVDGVNANTANKPFTINGVTFVPLREVGNILGTEVDWEAVNNTILINSNSNQPVGNAKSKVAANTSVGTKIVNVYYNNIKINVDGSNVFTKNEPFTIDGVTYVPLREIGNILGAKVDWDAVNNTILIYSNINGDEQSDENEVPVENSGSEDTSNEPVENSEPKDENTLFAELLFDEYSNLKNVSFDKFELTGDRWKVKFNIYLDLDNNTNAWNALTDLTISDWLEDIATEIQKNFDKDTKVTGKIILISNGNVLMDFVKDGDTIIKTSFYDANYRTGVKVKITSKPVDNSYGKRYYVDNLDFIITTASYNEYNNYLDVVLKATKDNTKLDWDKFSTRDKNTYVMEVCDKMADDFANEFEDLKQINLNFKDKSNSQIELFRYDVEAEKFLR